MKLLHCKSSSTIMDSGKSDASWTSRSDTWERSRSRVSSCHHKKEGDTHILLVFWESRGAPFELQQTPCEKDSGSISEWISSWMSSAVCEAEVWTWVKGVIWRMISPPCPPTPQTHINTLSASVTIFTASADRYLCSDGAKGFLGVSQISCSFLHSSHPPRG